MTGGIMANYLIAIFIFLLFGCIVASVIGWLIYEISKFDADVELDSARATGIKQDAESQ